MQRRLELACALVHDPAILFLDEPTAGLDPLLRQTVWTELHRLRERGRTILVTTQYVGEAEECDAVALISEGRLAALATPEELRRSATGGDVLEVETGGRDRRRRVLVGLPMVRSVDQRSATGLPRHRGRGRGGHAGDRRGDRGRRRFVTSSREFRPCFDDVFATLVDRHRRQIDRSSGGNGGNGDGPAGRPPDGGMIAAPGPTRLLAFVGKELIEVVRRPGALFSLSSGRS